jgi:hypothetical protein
MTITVAAQRLALTVYGAGAPNTVIVHNLGAGRTEWSRIGTGEGFFTADGRYAVLTRQPSSSSPSREIYDTATEVTLPMPPGLLDVMVAHPRELAVFGATLAATQGTDVGRLDLGGLRVFPACSPGSVVQVDITTDGSQLVVRCGGFSPNRLIVLNAATGHLLREATVGLALVSASASNHDGSRVLIARATSANASSVELVDTVANLVTTVFVDSPFPTGVAVGGCSVVGVAAARDVAAVNCAWTDFTTRVARTELVRFDTLQRRTLAAVPETASMHFSPDGAAAIVVGGPGLQLLDLAADAVLAQLPATVGGVGVAFPPMARPMERVRHATGPDVQPEPVAQERGDFAVREAKVFIEQHDQRDRVRAEMRARRTEGLRRLPRVASLHAPTTVATPTHMHIEATHMRPHHRQILLNLRGDARLDQAAAALRTRRGEGDVDPFVNRRRRLPMGMSAVTTTGASSGRTRTGRRRAFREGRCLSLPRAPHRLERLGQPLNLPPQALALAFQTRVLLAEPLAFISRALDLTAQPLQLSLGVLDALRLVAQRHATVMADSRKKYKSKLWITR